MAEAALTTAAAPKPDRRPLTRFTLASSRLFGSTGKEAQQRSDADTLPRVALGHASSFAVVSPHWPARLAPELGSLTGECFLQLVRVDDALDDRDIGAPSSAGKHGSITSSRDCPAAATLGKLADPPSCRPMPTPRRV